MKTSDKKIEKNVITECISYCIMAMIFLVFLILHLNPELIAVILICILEILICIRKNRRRSISKTILQILGTAFGLLLLLFFRIFFWLNYLLPYHSVSDYQGDIAYYKHLSPEHYGAFPDQIPENANHIKWIIMPGCMQGSGHEMLSFQADDAYLEQIRNHYTGTVCVESYDQNARESKLVYIGKDNVYTYHKDEHAWKNQNDEYAPTTSFHLEKSDPEGIEVFIVYEFNERHGFIASGINIDSKNNRVTFWAN
ncbi:MAG: hypothetical protein K6B69_01490 [Lachnospiraceae bacterium]|nr:hypothetical protein [Lachnospiraceae bacterium]